MRQSTLLAGFGLIIGLLANAAPATAQANRTYVSAQGDDSHPCTAAAPCRTLQVAHDNTNSGGEIMVLSPAGYGNLNITKAISVFNDGIGEVGMLAGGVTINAGSFDTVNLQGLTLNGVNAAANGIELVSAGRLNLQNCVIQEFTNSGLLVHPAGSTTTSVNISDSTFTKNFYGAQISPTGTGALNVSFTRVQAIGNNYGLRVASPLTGNGVTATIVGSLAADNSPYGFEIFSASPNGSKATMTITNSVAVNNGNALGIFGANATMLIGGNTITANSNAFDFSSGTFNSFGNNYIRGNSSDGAAITLVPTR